jgi:hypothetical protein
MNISDKIMVINRGLNHSSYKDVSPVTHLRKQAPVKKGLAGYAKREPSEH